jgi:Domain of unknown function (DUF4349)
MRLRPRSRSPFDRATAARHLPGALRFPSLRAALLVGAACSGTALLLTACSASGPSGSKAVNGPDFGSGAHAGAAVPRAAAAGPGYVGAPSSAAAHNGSAGLVLSVQSIIYTADLTLKVKDVTATATSATNLVTAVGGYVSGEQEVIPHSGGTPQVTLTLKIPVSQYHPTLAKLTALGSQVAFSQQAQDVTQEVADVASRVTSAQDAIRQLRALLNKAGSVGALLQVQDEINAQESALEALQAQQSALAHETSYGTVTVTLFGHHLAIVKKHKKKTAASGFGAGLRAGWHALVAVVTWLLAAIGALLPFLIPVAVIAAIAWEIRRRLARRRHSPAGEPPAAATS